MQSQKWLNPTSNFEAFKMLKVRAAGLSPARTYRCNFFVRKGQWVKVPWELGIKTYQVNARVIDINTDYDPNALEAIPLYFTINRPPYGHGLTWRGHTEVLLENKGNGEVAKISADDFLMFLTLRYKLSDARREFVRLEKSVTEQVNTIFGKGQDND